MRWNLADIFDAVAAVVPPERPAIIQGGRCICWGEFDRRSNRAARALMVGGVSPGDRVALLCRNSPAYIEMFVACLKARLAPVNLNYRYLADEIAYVLRDSGASVLLFEQAFAPVVAALRQSFPDIAHWICADGPADAPATASFEAWCETGDGAPLGITRSGDDRTCSIQGAPPDGPKVSCGHRTRSGVTSLNRRLFGACRERLRSISRSFRPTPRQGGCCRPAR